MNQYSYAFLAAVALFMSCQQPPTAPDETICFTQDVSMETLVSPQEPQTTAKVKFLVTADPQYDRTYFYPENHLTLNADTIFMIAKRRLLEEGYQGLLICGDLTHNALFDEFERYQRMTKDIVPYLYEGLGNHDFRHRNGEPYDSLANSLFGFEQMVDGDIFGWHNGSLHLFEYVRDHKRNTPVNVSTPNIHYSWDWEGIHFVQLNLSPADAPRLMKPLQDPFMAYSFLKRDLENRVGDSGRPVILLHHYGLDDFSRGVSKEGHFSEKAQWWSKEDQQKYWELLADYQVIGIFTGHTHRCEGCEGCYLPWDGKNIGMETVSGRAIPTFVAGAAREGYYMAVEVLGDQIIVDRYQKERLISRFEIGIEWKKGEGIRGKFEEHFDVARWDTAVHILRVKSRNS